MLGAAAALLLPGAARASDALAQALRGPGPGAVMLFRHALAPGTFDPPNFRLGDCTTQRNLSEQGRQQARQIGAWFSERGLKPTRVRSSPWCRCVDTARLAFGERNQAWAALGSPRAGTEATNAQALAQLRSALAAAVAQPGGFEVWVSHNFVLQALLGEGAASGEGLLLGLADGGAPLLRQRLPAPAL